MVVAATIYQTEKCVRENKCPKSCANILAARGNLWRSAAKHRYRAKREKARRIVMASIAPILKWRRRYRALAFFAGGVARHDRK